MSHREYLLGEIKYQELHQAVSDSLFNPQTPLTLKTTARLQPLCELPGFCEGFAEGIAVVVDILIPVSRYAFTDKYLIVVFR